MKAVRAPIPWLAWLLPALVIALAFAQEVVTITDAQIERLTQSFGQTARTRLTQWRTIMTDQRYRAATERQKLELVNDFMNLTPFKSDREHWGKEDYWATPIEFLSTNGGDCEDFTIARYFTLRELGVAPQKLRLTYVKARIGGPASTVTQAHMVLAYYADPAAEPLILDNLIGTIRPASQRSDLQPVFSFNADGIWVGGGPSPNSSVDRLTR